MIFRILRNTRSLIRNSYLTKRYGFRGKNIKFGKNVEVRNPQYISVGDNVFFDEGVELCVNKTIADITPQLQIGHGVVLGKYNRIGCDNKIVIGNNALFAPNVHISDRNHGYENIDLPIKGQPITTKGPVVIGEDSWLGFGCQIMSGVTIGKHCIVSAGAVVVKDVPDYSIVGGIPARILKRYNIKTHSWEKVY